MTPAQIESQKQRSCLRWMTMKSIVNLQGDEYGLPVTLINQVASNLCNNPDKQVATLCERINSMDDLSRSKISLRSLFDKNNTAIYFSRSPIPMNRSGGLPEQAYRHIGLYAYRAGYLQEFTQLAPCAIEQAEALEQLRALYKWWNNPRRHCSR